MTNVVFDVGNVLIHWDARLILQNDFTTLGEVEAFLDEIGFDLWNLEQDRGRTWDAAVALKVAEFPQHESLIHKLHVNWHDAVPGPIDASVRALTLLQDFAKPLYAITNFSAEKWAECQRRFDFLNGFADVVVSAHEGLIKPDPAIFDLFLTRNGLNATDCLFIDDSAANIRTADLLGFDTIHAADPAVITPELRARGLLP